MVCGFSSGGLGSRRENLQMSTDGCIKHPCSIARLVAGGDSSAMSD